MKPIKMDHVQLTEENRVFFSYDFSFCLQGLNPQYTSIKVRGGFIGKSACLFLKMSLAMLSSPGTHCAAVLCFCKSASLWASAVLYSPELLYSALLGLHGHHTNKNPS